MLADGTVAAYVTPSDGSDTFFGLLDFGRGRARKAIVGGDQGNLRCLPSGQCYGVNTDPTVLVQVDARSGNSSTALPLPHYVGYSVDTQLVDPDTGLYHATLVGKPHGAHGAKSNQYLVTVNVTQSPPAIVAQVPVGRTFMGPLVVCSAQLATFGSDKYDGLTAVDWRTGAQRRVGTIDLGTVYMFDAVGLTELMPAPRLPPLTPLPGFLPTRHLCREHLPTAIALLQPRRRQGWGAHRHKRYFSAVGSTHWPHCSGMAKGAKRAAKGASEPKRAKPVGLPPAPPAPGPINSLPRRSRPSSNRPGQSPSSRPRCCRQSSTPTT